MRRGILLGDGGDESRTRGRREFGRRRRRRGRRCGAKPPRIDRRLDVRSARYSSTRRMSASNCARYAVKRAAAAPSMTR
ncbi:hypothetical protein [Lysobacter gummosus]|uniref:hypothetical protein n=1 Tax=Lysobacter gummosus TaxID=262324 RepID=UPI003630751A